MNDAQTRRLIDDLVGPLTAAETGTVLGRNSATRLACNALGVAGHLPPPPAIADDPTLRYVREGHGRDGTRAVRRSSPRRGITRGNSARTDPS